MNASPEACVLGDGCWAFSSAGLQIYASAVMLSDPPAALTGMKGRCLLGVLRSAVCSRVDLAVMSCWEYLWLICSCRYICMCVCTYIPPPPPSPSSSFSSTSKFPRIKDISQCGWGRGLRKGEEKDEG